MLQSCSVPSDHTRSGKLQDETDTLELKYYAFACYCPRWCQEDLKIDTVRPGRDCIRLEASHDSLEVPTRFLVSGNKFRFIGQFYQEAQYGKDVEDGGLARTFLYSSFEVVDTIDHRSGMSETESNE
ncbi:MAG: hypothetical protein JJ975_00275 [Bacteroidia bacterium]|nr:hypothetical protein [Bacteroidia bacterium]